MTARQLSVLYPSLCHALKNLILPLTKLIFMIYAKRRSLTLRLLIFHPPMTSVAPLMHMKIPCFPTITVSINLTLVILLILHLNPLLSPDFKQLQLHTSNNMTRTLLRLTQAYYVQLVPILPVSILTNFHLTPVSNFPMMIPMLSQQPLFT